MAFATLFAKWKRKPVAVKVAGVPKKTAGGYEVATSVATATAAIGHVRKVLLAGKAVYTALEARAAPPAGFIGQAPRDAAVGVLATLVRTAPKAQVYVDQRLIGLRKLRFAVAFDGYLSWGLRAHRRQAMILFGGAVGDGDTYVEVLVFSDGRLSALYEKVLPLPSAVQYRDTIDAMVKDLRFQYPTARMVQASPLPSWDLADVEYVGEAPLRGLSFRPLSKMARAGAAYVWPATVAVLAGLIYIGLLGAGWSHYGGAMEDYEVAIADPAIRDKGGIDTHYLDVMNARRYYMDAPRRQVMLADKAAMVIRGVAAVDRIHILEMRLPAPSVNPQQHPGVRPADGGDRRSGNQFPDVWISVSVPKAMAQSALDQGQDVATRIARQTRMDVRVVHQGWREDKGRRIFNLEGFLNE